jgi:DNA-binding MarR family transcriptional regulator
MSRETARAHDRAALRDAVLDEIMQAPRAMGAMRHHHGEAVSLIHLHVLGVIERAETPPTMRALAEAIGASPASATGIVDRMERRGLVRRLRDDADRRIVRVELTQSGRDLLDGFAAERRETLAALLDDLSVSELDGLLRGVRALRRARERRQVNEGAAAGESTT